MTIRYIAFLRAINVGGHNVKMNNCGPVRGEWVSATWRRLLPAEMSFLRVTARGFLGLLEKKIEKELHRGAGLCRGHFCARRRN